MVDSTKPLNDSPEAIQLSERQAYDAMSAFVRQFYERAGDDLALLVSDIAWERDVRGREVTSDPAAWPDWQRCVRETLGVDEET